MTKAREFSCFFEVVYDVITELETFQKRFREGFIFKTRRNHNEKRSLLALAMVVHSVFPCLQAVAALQQKETQAPAGSEAATEAATEQRKKAQQQATQQVYYLNFKPEQDAQWQELAKLYTERDWCPVTVLTAASGNCETTLKSEMAKTDAQHYSR